MLTDKIAKEQLFAILKDKWQRLNSLYWIIDKHGKSVKFRCNVDQTRLYEQMWYMNILLKDRQRGGTTFICLMYLDDVLFIDNIEAGIIAHKEADAIKIFRRKVKYPYDHLSDEIKTWRPLQTKRNDELAFPNNSTIFVSTSMRSGTVQRLHLSEFGKVCATFPEKAKEIVSGSLEAIHPGEIVWIESTAEGREGYFYEYCMEAWKAQQERRKLSKLEFKLHFLGWTSDPDKRWHEPTAITDANERYFEGVERKLKIKLTQEQKWWYAAKKRIQRHEMKKENPATIEEAFEAAIEGAYYSEQLEVMREENRVCAVPFIEGIPVSTFWDLGWDDSTTIWFAQEVGREVHLIDYYENSHASLLHYGKVLHNKAVAGNWVYGAHWGPHDTLKHELGTGKTIQEQARELEDPVDGKSYAFNFQVAPRINTEAEGIEAVRSIFHRLWFDKVKTTQTIKSGGSEKDVGLPSIENYRQEWDPKKEKFVNKPYHNWASHGAKALETLAIAHGYTGKFGDMSEVFK